MRLPAFFLALWPIAAFSGGKLFAPLLFVLGLAFGWRHLGTWPRRDVLVFGLFLLWVCLTAIWSPASAPIISGSLWTGNFAIEAGHIRFVLSAVGGCLFLAVVAGLPADKTSRLLRFFPLAVLVHLGILVWLAAQRDSILIADSSQIFVPSAQSLGRNTNLLAVVLPLAIGVWVDRFSGLKAGVLAGLLLAAATWVLLAHDALAGLLGWTLGGGIALLLFSAGKSGFRWVFNIIAAAILAAPVLAKALITFAPPHAVALPLSAEQRLMIWQSALEKIANKPLFGHGVDAVNVWDETFATRPDMLAALDPSLLNARLIPNHTHNIPLHVWAEAGLIGALLLALALVFLGRALPAPSALTRGTKIAVAGVLGGALSLFAVAYSAWDESFWASLAVVVCALIVLSREKQALVR